MQRLIHHPHPVGSALTRGLHLVTDILLSLIALLFTLTEIIARAGIYLCKKTLGLFVRILYVALLAVFFLAGYCLLMGMQMVGGGINSNLS